MKKLLAAVLTLCVVGVLPASGVTLADVGSGASVTSPTWVRTGGPVGGMGYDIRFKSSDPSRMYVTDAFAGVFGVAIPGALGRPATRGSPFARASLATACLCSV